MTAAPTVLVVDDEEKIRKVARAYLEADGFAVEEAADGPTALEAAARRPPDVVVLDIMLPGMDGLEVLRRLRAGSEVYVILLTARAEEVDKLVGLSLGADDYVTKPFSPRELAARVKAVLRRSREATTGTVEVLETAHLQIDTARREVREGDRVVELSVLEFDLLVALATSPGRVFTRRQLLEKVWGYDFFGDERVVDVHIRNLRRALGDDAVAARIIGTVRGVGYRLLSGEAR
ncbi:MAG TPA: response regulator transcription factor [Acidimicrobiales bacterium]|nr:response regulator transcription factor [Acidimicrobiales bacterium]